MKVKRHFPASFRDFAEGEIIDFDINPDVNELLGLEFIKSVNTVDDASFYRFSLGNLGYSKFPITLMAEYDGGKKWYVIARLEHMIDGLPEWHPKEVGQCESI